MVGVERTVDDVLDAVLSTAPVIRSVFAGERGETASENPSGERQIEADVRADELLVDRLTAIDGVGEVATEERETTVDCGDGLAVAVDPLDGSSNLASNNPVGTIVGIYDAPLPATGRDLLAAGYVCYGPRTTATIARARTPEEAGTPADAAVTEREYVDGEWRVVDDDRRLPEETTVYGVGGGDDDWPEPVAAVVAELRHQLNLRYSGAMVADVNQVLEYGGLFAYPALRSRSHGKLRHQFEVAPIAYVVEAAGGASTDGGQSLLDRPATELHARSPCYVGNREPIARVEEQVGRAVGALKGETGR